ncbi:hypothetical protein, partial [Streptomyces clavuligerus]
MAAGYALRLAHTAVLAAVCVVVSGLGHALAAGVSPSPQGYVFALPPVLAASWRLTRARRSAGVVVVACAAQQLALHVLFGLVAHGGPGDAAGHPAGHAPAQEVPLGGDGGLFGYGVHLDALAASLTSGMAGAHLLAGAVCGWWIWRGEQALVQLGRALALFADGPVHSVRTALIRTALIDAVLRGTHAPPTAPP